MKARHGAHGGAPAKGSRGAGRAGHGVRAGSGPARLAAAAAEPGLRFRQPLRDCRREESEEPPPGSSLPSAESGAATGRDRLPGPSPGGEQGGRGGSGVFPAALKVECVGDVYAATRGVGVGVYRVGVSGR